MFGGIDCDCSTEGEIIVTTTNPILSIPQLGGPQEFSFSGLTELDGRCAGATPFCGDISVQLNSACDFCEISPGGTLTFSPTLQDAIDDH